MSKVENIEPVEVELSEKQKYIQSQLDNLGSKETNLMFQLDQIKAAQQVFHLFHPFPNIYTNTILYALILMGK